MSSADSASSFFSRAFSCSNAFRALDVSRLHLSKVLAPRVDRGLADLVLLGGLGHRGSICLTQDRDHLLLGESTFNQWPEESGQVTTKFAGWVDPGNRRLDRHTRSDDVDAAML